jgi:hypothetical protein
MSYIIDIYKKSEDNSLRYVLGAKGKNPLVVLGLNPSTADDKKSDLTVTKIMGFAKKAENDGFIIINLYPLRATDSRNLPKEMNSEHHRTNLEIIDATLNDYPEIDVLVAFGGGGICRQYLKDCLKDIVATIGKRKVNWYKIGSLTQSGHPRHPSRAKYEALTPFDPDGYMKKLKLNRFDS